MWILPGPVQVLQAMISHAVLYMASYPDHPHRLARFCAFSGIGSRTALLLHYLNWLCQALYPLFIVSQTIPLIVLAVLLPLWFGWGMFPKILIIILVCFFPMVINLFNGLKAVDPDILNLFRSLWGQTPGNLSPGDHALCPALVFCGFAHLCHLQHHGCGNREWLGPNAAWATI